MSYSLEEFFEDNLNAPLVALFKETINENDSRSEEFFSILRKAMQQHRSEYFASVLLRFAIDPDDEDMPVDKAMRKFFEIFTGYEDRELRKLEYAENGSIISVNYQGIQEEEDLRQRVAEEIALKKVEK